MSEFQVYLQLGFDHISDLNAYDHIVFIIALCAAYPLNRWRSVIVLVTAFTIGHSITLALATLRLVLVPTDLVETLIPVTILATCLMNAATDGLSRPPTGLNRIEWICGKDARS